MKTMNKKKLLMAQIGEMSKQLEQEHCRYIIQRQFFKAHLTSPPVLLVGGFFVLFIGIKVYKGQWGKAFKTLTRYSLLFVGNHLKRQLMSYF